MPGHDRPEPLQPLADFDDAVDDATEELSEGITQPIVPVLPDYDDDPATEAIEQHVVGLPSGYQVLRALAPEHGRERFEVVHSLLGRVLVLEVAEEVGDLVFTEWATRRSQLTQPGVLQVYEVGRLDDGRAYLTHGRPEGQTLDVWAGRATRAGVLLALISAARTVGTAHARGLTHGALCTENLLVLRGGQVIVVGWCDGTAAQDVDALASVLTGMLGTRIPPRLAVVIKRAHSRQYPDAHTFADALVDVLKIG